jgi:hypothetical protein
MTLSETAARLVPDFWGFLQKTIAMLDEESAKVKSDDEMKNLLDRWLHSENGVLARLEDDPSLQWPSQVLGKYSWI